MDYLKQNNENKVEKWKKLSFKIICKVTKTLIYMIIICRDIIFQEQNFLVLFPYLIEMMTLKITS